MQHLSRPQRPEAAASCMGAPCCLASLASTDVRTQTPLLQQSAQPQTPRPPMAPDISRGDTERIATFV